MKYRKKPVVIEAVQFTEDMARGFEDGPEGVCLHSRTIGPPPELVLIDYRFYIDTLEGKMNVTIDDWIITGVNGERYPCKPDIFEKTYEKVED